MIQQVGLLIARGALISVILIFFVLPLMFKLFDGFIRHTSLKLGFYDEHKDQGAASAAGAPACAATADDKGDSHRLQSATEQE
jgi:hypothetical protein